MDVSGQTPNLYDANLAFHQDRLESSLVSPEEIKDLMSLGETVDGLRTKAETPNGMPIFRLKAEQSKIKDDAGLKFYINSCRAKEIVVSEKWFRSVQSPRSKRFFYVGDNVWQLEDLNFEIEPLRDLENEERQRNGLGSKLRLSTDAPKTNITEFTVLPSHVEIVINNRSLPIDSHRVELTEFKYLTMLYEANVLEAVYGCQKQ